MPVLIGCSPSTGSSLLRRMLHRHSEVFCGPETSLFAKAELYSDWSSSKNKLFKKSFFGLTNAGWHNFVGVNIEEGYLWSKLELKSLIDSSDTFSEFAERFYDRCLKEQNKKLWVEKTPSNAFTLSQFLEDFSPEAKVVHIYRHPLDAIASLVSRGLTVYNSCALYLLNTSVCMALDGDDRCHSLSYENLVHQPAQVLHDLCSFLNVNYEEAMLEKTEEEGGVTIMTGWQSDETDPPNVNSIGRFHTLTSEVQNRILNFIHLMSSELDTKDRTITDIALSCGYELPSLDTVDPAEREVFLIERDRDLRKRTFSRNHFRQHNYPIKNPS